MLVPIRKPLLLAAAAALAAAGATRALSARDGLDEAAFSRLHALLEPPEAAWRRLPWCASVLEARRRATRDGKPVYMLVRSGNPLGCV